MPGSADAGSLDEVAEGARVGTSSLRRRAQLLALRPDLEIVELRGNVDTRLGKVEEVGGIVLAAAGLRRLGLEGEIGFRFETGQLTPSPGQGTVALELRLDDERAREAASAITEPLALSAFNAERAAVEALGASCDTPVGVVARVDGSGMKLTGFAGLPDGSEWVRDTIEREASDPSAAGLELAHRMKAPRERSSSSNERRRWRERPPRSRLSGRRRPRRPRADDGAGARADRERRRRSSTTG